jgi:diacylglycerol O-acyltransferase / wax synthase
MARQRMSGADAAWLHMDRPENPMIITSLLWTDEPVDWDRYREVIADRLVARYPRFSQRVVEPAAGVGVPHWRDDEHFELDLHLHRASLPAPGGKEDLARFVGDVMSTPLHPGRPLWQAYVIDRYGPGSAVVMRIHHCIADGIALMRVLMSLADGGEDLCAPPRGVLGRLRDAATQMTSPQAVLGAGKRAAGQAVAVGNLVVLPADHVNQLEQPLSGVKQAAWSRPIPVEAVKQAGIAAGATINDVLLAGVAAALQPHVDQGVADVRALVPFNVRGSFDAPVPATLGNKFGMVFVDLPVAADDPVQRLLTVKQRMDELKSSPQGAAAFQVMGVMGRLPVSAERVLVRLFTSKGSLVLTNVPGPREPVRIAGAPIAGTLAWVPQSGNIGLGVSIVSYNGSVHVGVAADRNLIADPAAVVDSLEQALGDLGVSTMGDVAAAGGQA